jgi:uracil-DNA glycosylase
MAVKSLLDLKQVNPCRNKICRACGLYLNQKPIYDEAEKSHVFWVGLSAVQFHEDEHKQPLAPSTSSGSLIRQIELPFKKDIFFYKTNLVKCVPLKNDKIRYPLQHEIEKCFPNFEVELEELNPTIVFLLGKQVANFVIGKVSDEQVSLSQDFIYRGIKVGDTLYVPVHHPSFILVYKRKQLNQYIDGIQKFFTELNGFSKRNKLTEKPVGF